MLPLDGSPGLPGRGEGDTPLVAESVGPVRVVYLLDYLNPSGSYKDRGAWLMVSCLRAEGARRLVADSSGNAGAACALYAAQAGLTLKVYAPAGLSAGKRSMMERLGATVEPCEGATQAEARREASRRAEAEASVPGAGYASHVWHPAFVHGVKSAAFEIAAASAPGAPAAVVVPVGNGALIRGIALGFRELLDAGLVERLPALVGVQAARCAPVARALASRAGLDPPEEERGETACEGIRIASPPLVGEIVEEIAGTGGWVRAVAEADVHRALRSLWRSGFPVELTSATVAAAVAADAPRLAGLCGKRGFVAAVLTGSGLREGAVP